MLKFQIHLTGPICTCLKEDLSWFIRVDQNKKPTLGIRCKTCETELVQPRSMAEVFLEKPYPQTMEQNIKEAQAITDEDLKFLKSMRIIANP